MRETSVPFNIPPVAGRELEFIGDALKRRKLSGNGHFTQVCKELLIKLLSVRSALVTHSCTGALEMAAILANLVPGDEVIMPSFTFASTANAVVLRGAIPVFVDIRPDTLNIDECLIEAAITTRTKAIIVVHYAGICAEMDAIYDLAKAHGLFVIEDAAQALLSTYRNRAAGTLGDVGCFSFHASKNIVSGEGGALVTDFPDLAERAEILYEKGTNRTHFLAGLVDKYVWTDVGSSFAPSELVTAFLSAQLEAAESITAERRATWEIYHAAFAELEARDIGLRRPTVPEHCTHNGHIYYLLVPSEAIRDRMITELRKQSIETTFHYVPLHSSPAGRRYCKTPVPLPHTEQLSSHLIRLPLWHGMGIRVQHVIESVCSHISLHLLPRPKEPGERLGAHGSAAKAQIDASGLNSSER